MTDPFFLSIVFVVALALQEYTWHRRTRGLRDNISRAWMCISYLAGDKTVFKDSPGEVTNETIQVAAKMFSYLVLHPEDTPKP